MELAAKYINTNIFFLLCEKCKICTGLWNGD